MLDRYGRWRGNVHPRDPSHASTPFVSDAGPTNDASPDPELRFRAFFIRSAPDSPLRPPNAVTIPICWARYAIVATLLVTACQRAGSTFSTATPVRAGQDLPDRFDPPAAYPRISPADTIAGAACVTPMRDPRDGTELRMVRSSADLADYAVPEGRYGVASSELLRVHCNTGQPRGIVQREE